MPDLEHHYLTGGCACGAIRFEIDRLMRPIIGCQ